MAIPDPYKRQIFHGKLLDNATIQAVKVAEHRLGYRLTIIQGIGGASASAGTHTEGRAIDLAAWDHKRKVKVLRDLGFAAWYRPDLPGVWGEHIHAVLIFPDRTNRKGLASAGYDQIGKYDRKEDGLANPPTPDPNPYRPDPKEKFTLAEYKASFGPTVVRPAPTNVTKARDQLVEAIHNLGQAAALLDDTNPNRVRARAQIDDIRQARRAMIASLEALPQR